MKELWLKYTDENGAPKKVLMRGEKFTIGRYPENDLCIPLSQLSRMHAEIDRFGDVYVISDNNSSNGTTVNGRTIERPTSIENGDRINLGGGAELQVELISTDFEEPISPAESTPENESQDPADSSATPEADSVPAAAASPAVAAPAKPQSSGFSMFFILAPILVVVFLVFAGIMVWLFGSGKSDDNSRISKRGGYDYSDDDKPNKNKKSNDSTETPTPSPKSSSTTTNSSPTPEVKETQSGTTTNQPVSSDRDKIESNAYSFLRKIAKADQNPVLTSKQIEMVSARAKSFKGSSALQGNLQDLKKKSGEIETLARSKSLRPQFLATAALAQLGNKRGDVLATAQSMASSLNQLSNLLSNDLSSDSLMIIAASQDEAAAKSMPSKLANLTNKFPNESPQTVRSIWFLHDKNQIITPAQFDFALQFLAIGTIMQNPKDFSVDTEPVTFN